MSKTLSGRLLVTGSAFAIASCGGDGTSFVSSTPPPPVGGTPSPTASPAVFPSITSDTDFAVLGLEATAMDTPASALKLLIKLGGIIISLLEADWHPLKE